MADLPHVNTEEIDAFRTIAQSDADGPVFMLNLKAVRPQQRINVRLAFMQFPMIGGAAHTQDVVKRMKLVE